MATPTETPLPGASGDLLRDLFDHCYENPDFEGCDPAEDSYYGYRISLAPNALFAALFGLSFLGYVATYAVTRRGLAFTVAMLLGVLCELLGYAGRLISWGNQWDENGFLMQICCLTIGPAFLAAGVYLCLRRIVFAFGRENSAIPPEWYTRFFIPCDVISLVLQALGGGMASVSSHNNESTQTGNDIMMAGLAFQVFTLVLFISASAYFAFRTVTRYRRLGADAFDQDPVVAKVRGSFLFKGFLAALAVATLCIFWRSVYRVAELSEGWDGPLMRREDLFIGFEGVMIVVAVLVLNVFHPSVSFKELMEGEGGLGGCFGRKRKVVDGVKEEKNGSGNVSEA